MLQDCQGEGRHKRNYFSTDTNIYRTVLEANPPKSRILVGRLAVYYIVVCEFILYCTLEYYCLLYHVLV